LEVIITYVINVYEEGIEELILVMKMVQVNKIERKIYFYYLHLNESLANKYLKQKGIGEKIEDFRVDPFGFIDKNFQYNKLFLMEYGGTFRKLLFYRHDPRKFNLTPYLPTLDVKIFTGTIGFGKKIDIPTIIDEKTGMEVAVKFDPESQALYFPTHFVLFSNGVIGMESWREGPSVSALKYFLSKALFGIHGIISIDEIYRLEFLIDLFRKNRVTLLKIRVPALKYIYYKEGDSDTVKLFKYSSEIFGEADYIEITVAVDGKKKGRGLNPQRVVKVIEELLRLKKERGAVEKAIVKIEDPITGILQERNIFEEKLLKSVKVIRFKNNLKRADSGSMYNAIIEAYSEFEKEIVEFINGMKKHA